MYVWTGRGVYYSWRITELYNEYCSVLILWLDVVTKLKFMDIVTLVIVCIH